MTTNLLIGYPDIPFSVGSIVSTATYSTSFPKENLITGSRASYGELTSSIVGQHELQFDMGSSNTLAMKYAFLARAKRLLGSGNDNFDILASDYSANAPIEITTPTAWIDFTKNVTVDSANGISQVDDRSGGTNHATQATSASRPQWTRADNKENQLKYSEDAGDSSWTSQGLTSATSASIADSQGVVTATRLLCDSGTSRHQRYQVGYLTRPIGNTYTFSVEVKKDNYQYLWIGDSAFFAWHGAGFNLNTGAFTGNETSLTSKSVSDLGNGWYKVTVSYTADSAANPSPGVYFDPTGAAQPASFTGAGTEAVYIARASFRDGSADSTYIKTTSYRQFRGINGNRCGLFDSSDDYLLANGIAAAITGNDKPYTISFACSCVDTAVTAKSLISFGRTSSANPYIVHRYYIALMDSATGDDAAALTANPNYSTLTTSPCVITLKTTGTSLTVYLNGVSLGSQSFDVGALTLDTCSIGSFYRNGAPIAANYFSGKIGEVIIYNSALSDADRAKVEGYLTAKWITSRTALDLTDYSGRLSEDFFKKFASTQGPSRYYIARFDASTGSKRPLSKLYFGDLFDFGREPVYTQFQDSADVEAPQNREPTLKFTLTWEGISNTIRNSFIDKIYKYREVNPVVIYDTNGYTFHGWETVHARIVGATFTPENTQCNTIAVTFEELI